MKRVIIALILMLVSSASAVAQCAMCRTTIVNNVSHGETRVAAYLNTGILYLFFTPYILVGLIVFLWYRNSKVNENKVSIISRIKG